MQNSVSASCKEAKPYSAAHEELVWNTSTADYKPGKSNVETSLNPTAIAGNENKHH